jgi:hypothetical protein
MIRNLTHHAHIDEELNEKLVKKERFKIKTICSIGLVFYLQLIEHCQSIVVCLLMLFILDLRENQPQKLMAGGFRIDK